MYPLPPQKPRHILSITSIGSSTPASGLSDALLSSRESPKKQTMKINVPPCPNFSFYSQIKTNIERARVSCIHGDLQSGDGQSTVELKRVKAGGTFTTIGLFDERSSKSSHFFFEHSDFCAGVEQRTA